MMKKPPKIIKEKETINELKTNLISLIDQSLKGTFSIEIIKFKQNVIKILEEQFNAFIKNYFNNNPYNKNSNILKSRAISTIPNSKKLIIISNNLEPDYFTTQDIQKEYKDITTKFEKIAMKLVKDNETPKIKSLANFLKDVANISRQSFIYSKEINEFMKKKYYSEKNGKSDGKSDERKLFSIWLKNKEKYDKYLYNDYLNKKIPIITSKDENAYLKGLYNKLVILYLHCHLCSPPIEIKFKVEDKQFDEDTMLDFYNNGKGEFQFVYLPSLFTNDDFLGKNSKFWVYFGKNDEYRFSDQILDELNNFEIYKYYKKKHF